MEEQKKVLIILLIIGVALSLGPFFLPTFYQSLLFVIFIAVVLALSWNLVTGFGGLVLFGHHGIFGSGAYISALLTFYYGLNPLLSIILGSICTMLIWTGILYPCFRLRGHYFAIATLVLGQASLLIVTNLPNITQGAKGLSIGSSWNLTNSYWAMILITLCAIFVIYRISKSRFGLKLQSVRENEDVASALGVNSKILKMKSFLISTFFISLAAGVRAFYLGYLYPYHVFSLETYNVSIIFSTVLGGIGTVIGPIIGGSLTKIIQYYGAAQFPAISMIVFTGITIVILKFARGGIWGEIRKRM